MPERNPDYAFGHSTRELERLIDQAKFFGQLTRTRELPFLDQGQGRERTFVLRRATVGAQVGRGARASHS